MGSDDSNYRQPKGMSVSLQVKTPEEAERIIATLSESGTVRLPLQQTFFAPRFGMLTDQFRHSLDDQLRAAGVAFRASPEVRDQTIPHFFCVSVVTR